MPGGADLVKARGPGPGLLRCLDLPALKQQFAQQDQTRGIVQFSGTLGQLSRFVRVFGHPFPREPSHRRRRSGPTVSAFRRFFPNRQRLRAILFSALSPEITLSEIEGRLRRLVGRRLEVGEGD